MSEVKRIRSRTLKLKIDSSCFHHELILNIASEVTMALCSHSGKRLPNLARLRERLNPIYATIADILNNVVKNKTHEIEPEFLYGLGINMLVSAGYYVISVKYKDGVIITNYNIHMMPIDGKTVATRGHSHPINLIQNGVPVVIDTI